MFKDINNVKISIYHIVMVKFISEIGINHNGSLELCKTLIRKSHNAGCDFVKIQKRNPDICVPENQKTKRKQTPWGEMSYLEYKHKIEFNEKQIRELVDYSKSIGDTIVLPVSGM